MAEARYIGLMSGTSLDGVDGVLVEFPQADEPGLNALAGADNAESAGLRVLAHAYLPFDAALRSEFLALNRPGDNEIHRCHLAANCLAQVYAEVAKQLLSASGLTPPQVRAIGAHGQTVRHRPLEFDGMGYTTQIQHPALLAELSGIAVVADFRSRDLAAGGQGAPLVPAFHQALFGQRGKGVAVLNLGGIGNLSLISPRGEVLGFDCGPGNVLMDIWAQAQTGQSFDANGAFAAEGMVHEPLLEAMLADPFFATPPPKSTGRDLFNAAWLHRHLSASHSDGLEAHDVQATLAELTAVSATQAALAGLRSWGHDFSGHGGRCELLVCGGGALNAHLMRRLQAHWPLGPAMATEAKGLPAMQVEACAFAWLAQRHMQGLAGNLPSATGAKGPRILGALYPA